ncbi:MAG: hypothetical protein HYV13_00455 [Candidatus Doudnabacteria bacterium]|nr:hypothetical protein [Candidatus Doudnabacteria bacterium]
MAIPIDDQNIINVLGIQSLPEEQKISLLEKISELVEKRLLVRVLNSFSEQKKKEFEDLLDTENQEAVNVFLGKNAPEIGAWLNEELVKVKQEMAGLASNV